MKKRIVLVIALVILTVGVGSVYAASRCNACGGRGYTICTACNGSGYRQTGTRWNGATRQNDATYAVCYSCGGSGQKICSSCGGDGWR